MLSPEGTGNLSKLTVSGRTLRPATGLWSMFRAAIKVPRLLIQAPLLKTIRGDKKGIRSKKVTLGHEFNNAAT